MRSMLTGYAARVAATAQNALEVARYGGLDTGETAAPFDVAARERMYRLRHYFADADGDRPPALMVPPLMLAADVYDVSPQTSAVRELHARDVDPWVVDFGAPDQEEGGLDRTLADHVLALCDAIDRVHAATGRDVHLVGYSQGGLFCQQAAAYRRGDGLASLVTFGSPVDHRGALPLPLQPPDELLEGGAALIAAVLRRTSLSGGVARVGFRLLDPVKTLTHELQFLRQLHDREALLAREGQRRFMADTGWVAWPGPAAAELIRQFVTTNRLLHGGFVIEGRLVTLADVALPVLSAIGEADSLAPPDAIRAMPRAMPRSEHYELSVFAGHIGLVVGKQATAVSWPAVASWVDWCERGGVLPAPIRPMQEEASGAPAGARLEAGLDLAVGVGGGIVRSLGITASETARGI
ncbi:MAG: alpha/beta fold hydrolase, partial [Solirubrobacteraceae bacterium]